MGKSKPKNWATGHWLIESMDQWEKKYIDVEVPGYFDFGDNNLGSFHFGYVQGDLDYRLSQRDGNPAVEFSRLGLVVDHDTGVILMTSVLDEPPNAEHAADIMTRAMENSHSKVPCRPEIVFLRDNPTWEALLPWLGQLGIETIVTEDLLHWDEKAEELMEWMRKRWSPLPDVRTEIHEKLNVFDTLGNLRGLAYGFLYFEQPKDK